MVNDATLSPDGKFLWTGSEWIPAPPLSNESKSTSKWVHLEVLVAVNFESEESDCQIFHNGKIVYDATPGKPDRFVFDGEWFYWVNNHLGYDRTIQLYQGPGLPGNYGGRWEFIEQEAILDGGLTNYSFKKKKSEGKDAIEQELLEAAYHNMPTIRDLIHSSR